RNFRILSRYAGRRIFVQVSLALLIGYTETFGIALFLPIFEKSPANATDSISRIIVRFFGALHIPLIPAATLALVLVAFVLKGLLSFAGASYEVKSSAILSRKLRTRMIDMLSRCDYLWLTNSSTGFHANLLLGQIPRTVAGFLSFVRAMTPAVN